MSDLGAFKSEIKQRILKIFPILEHLEFEHHTIAGRPEPADGLPVLGRIPGIKNMQVAVLHSGITLAPIVAKLIAFELNKPGEDDRLLPYSIERFEFQEHGAA